MLFRRYDPARTNTQTDRQTRSLQYSAPLLGRSNDVVGTHTHTSTSNTYSRRAYNFSAPAREGEYIYIILWWGLFICLSALHLSNHWQEVRGVFYRRWSRILQGRVSNPSERGTPNYFWPMLPEPNNFFGLRRNSWRRAVVRHLELCQIPYQVPIVPASCSRSTLFS